MRERISAEEAMRRLNVTVGSGVLFTVADIELISGAMLGADNIEQVIPLIAFEGAVGLVTASSQLIYKGPILKVQDMNICLRNAVGMRRFERPRKLIENVVGREPAMLGCYAVPEPEGGIAKKVNEIYNAQPRVYTELVDRQMHLQVMKDNGMEYVDIK